LTLEDNSPVLDTYDLYLAVPPLITDSDFILYYWDSTELIKLLQWLQNIQRWVNKVLLARGNI